MKKFYFAAVALAITSFAGSALATECPNGAPHSAWPKCELPPVVTPPVVTPPVTNNTNTNTQQQTQAQIATARAQAQASARSNASAANAGQFAGQGAGALAGANAGRNAGQFAGQGAGANAGRNAGQGAGAGAGSGNVTQQAVTIEGAAAGSGANYSSKYIAHPSMIPPGPTAIVGAGQMQAWISQCEPLVSTRRIEIEAQMPTLLGSETVVNGYNISTGPKLDGYGGRILFDEVTDPRGYVYLMGHRKYKVIALAGQAFAGSLAGGIIKSSGAGGQLGGSVSSSAQQLVEYTAVDDCVFDILPPTDVIIIDKSPVVEPTRNIDKKDMG